MDESENIVNSKTIKLLYFAVLLVLLVLLCWHFSCWSKSESFTDVPNTIYTAGATMRRLDQEFTGTDQGNVNTIYLDQLKTLADAPRLEQLVSEKSEPNIWEISSELEAYRGSFVPGYN